MPRDNDKDNARPRGRRDRPSGGKDKPKSRSGVARGPEKKLAKRGLAGKSDRGDGDKRPYAGKSDGAKPSGKKPYARKPYAGAAKREVARPRGLGSIATTAARSVPTRRAGIHLAASAQPSNVTIARVTVATHVLQGVLPIRNLARSVPTPHAARVFGKTATVRSVRGRKVIGLIARVRRARVAARNVRIRRAEIAPSATRSFHAGRPTAARVDRAKIWRP